MITTLHTGHVAPEVLADLQRRTRGMKPKDKALYLFHCPEFPRPVEAEVNDVGLVMFVHSLSHPDLEYPTARDEDGIQHCPCIAHAERPFTHGEKGCWHTHAADLGEDSRRIRDSLKRHVVLAERENRKEKSRGPSVIERTGKSKVFRMAASVPPSGLTEKELEEDAWSRLT